MHRSPYQAGCCSTPHFLGCYQQVVPLDPFLLLASPVGGKLDPSFLSSWVGVKPQPLLLNPGWLSGHVVFCPNQGELLLGHQQEHSSSRQSPTTWAQTHMSTHA